MNTVYIDEELGTKASDMTMEMVFHREILGIILQVVDRMMEESHGFGNREHSMKIGIPSPLLIFSFYYS